MVPADDRARSARRRALAAAVLLATAMPAARAAAEVERFGVFIGNNRGAPGEVELRYAEADAAKLHETLMDLGGFPPENTVLLRGGDAEAVRRAIISTNERVRAARSAGRDSMLLVYYSGHADAHALHLGGERVATQVIEQLVKGSAADVRLLVLDACRSGGLTRAKGGRPAPQIQLQVLQPLASEGLVILSSSSASEDSQESDEISGSFFTHHLVSGLLGAADENADGLISLAEAYRYTYENTLRVTSMTLSVQHPGFRYEVRGQGELILTRGRTGANKRGWLELPAGRSYLLFARGRAGPLAAEMPESAKSRTLSLPAGRYFVRSRAATHLLEGEVDVVRGETRRVVDPELSRLEYARLVRKGLGPARSDSLVVAASGRGPLVAGGTPCLGGHGGYAADYTHFSLLWRAGACAGRHENDALSATDIELGSDILLGHAWDWGRVTVELGLSIGGGVLEQHYRTATGEDARTSFFAVLGGGLSALVGLSGPHYLRLGLSSQTYFFRQLESSSMVEHVRAHVVPKLEIGVGRSF
jgi:hypothetical protein